RELRNIVERLLCHEGGLINAAVVQRLLPLGSDPRLESGPAGRGSDPRLERGMAAVGSDPRLEMGTATVGSDPIFSRTLPFAEAKLALERQYLLAQYRLHGNSVKDTALALGLLPNNLSRRMRQLDIS
ncbi:MAG: hypothetical protein KKI09_10265, partial [Spirochaetes bacterium]|nr:hypothetical protein [Spirochaetota bacterium]MBU0955801.1 hypothetical protein [Spirochaetota bacterium]